MSIQGKTSILSLPSAAIMQEAHFNVYGEKSYPAHFAVQIYHAIKSSMVLKHTSCYVNIKKHSFN